MTEPVQTNDLPRITSGIPGLDAVLGGGLPRGRVVLFAGEIGTGKTTLASQIAFQHALTGEPVLMTSFMAESHDVLLANLRTFQFFNEHAVGNSIQFLNVMAPLLDGGIDAVLDTLRREVQQTKASLLVIDSTSVMEDSGTPALNLRQFAHRLETTCVLLGCTAVLLTSRLGDSLRLLGGSVNGVILLTHEMAGRRRLRLLDVLKMRGVDYATGQHEFAITRDGVTVFPRLESLIGHERPTQEATYGIGTGSDKIDAMLGGGLQPLSTTIVTGTPGSGKTILGLSFIYEGAQRGERGLVVAFHEREGDLVSTAKGIGRDLQPHLESGLVRVLWKPPLELSADAWAWEVLAAVEDHGSQRIFIDALTDVQRVMSAPDRLAAFVTALTNELRKRRTTVMMTAEIEAYSDTSLTIPVPAASATMDNGILLRHVELNGRLRRMVSVLKVRQSDSDPIIQELQITDQGIVVTGPFQATSGILTGRATLDESEQPE